MRYFFVEAFLDAYPEPPPEIVLDHDATDDPVHGRQEGRFFHGYYRADCCLPLYLFCGDHLLCSRLRRADGDGAAGAVEELADREPDPDPLARVAITIRADSGFARDEIMVFCKEHEIDYGLGLARKAQLEAAIEAELSEARGLCETTGTPARRASRDPGAARRAHRRHSRWHQKRYLADMSKVPMLVLGDLGMRKLPPTAAEDLLEIGMRCYARASTLLTSNRPVEGCGKLVGDTGADRHARLNLPRFRDTSNRTKVRYFVTPPIARKCGRSAVETTVSLEALVGSFGPRRRM